MTERFITVSTIINVTISKAWDLWTLPEHIIHWNHASEEWSCPKAETDLKIGGRYTFRMEAKDGSMGFDMSGTYLKIDKPGFLSYDMDDGRVIEVTFLEKDGVTEIIEKFEPESIHSRELQQQGWQAILNNFKIYAEQLENNIADQPVMVSQYFNHPQNRVWDAITNHEMIIQWFFDNIPSFSAERGFKTRFVVENEGRVFPHLWEIIEVINGEKITIDWKYEGYGGSSIVTFRIEKKESGCILEVEHVNTSPYDTTIPEFTRESCQSGWDYFIKERLVKYINQL